MGDQFQDQVEGRVRELVVELVESINPVHDAKTLVTLRVLESVRRAAREISDEEMLRARQSRPGRRGVQRHTWAEIGSALGVSSQAARQRAERRSQRWSEIP
jgi:hypothetical protein